MTEKKKMNWVIKNLLYGLVFILVIVLVVETKNLVNTMTLKRNILH